MEKFEQEIKDKVKEAIKTSNIDLHEVAESRIQYLAAVICRLVEAQEEDFNLIVAGGNSGLYILDIVIRAYKYLQKPLPPVVKIPVQRYNKRKTPEEIETFFDNSVLLPMVKDQLKGVQEVKNLLFVDDEIMMGTTASTSFKLILEAVYGSNYTGNCKCTIVAEHHNFEWHHDTPGLSIRFFSYGRFIPGFNNNIAHFIPQSLYQLAAPLVKEKASYNHVMAVIIGGGLKSLGENGVPYFDTGIEAKLLESIDSYNETKKNLQNELDLLVQRGIDRYRAGDIKFRF